MKITQDDLITTAYLFLIVGGLIAFGGSLLVYFIKRTKRKKR